jgi:mannose-1-phosphate guanylyltransferase
LKQANDNKLVTFGIVPTDANTGYGYIKSLKNGQVEAFVEKPDLQTAQSYLKQGSYLWNSGMFMFQPQTCIGCINNNEIIHTNRYHHVMMGIDISVSGIYSTNIAFDDIIIQGDVSAIETTNTYTILGECTANSSINVCGWNINIPEFHR